MLLLCGATGLLGGKVAERLAAADPERCAREMLLMDMCESVGGATRV